MKKEYIKANMELIIPRSVDIIGTSLEQETEFWSKYY